MVPGFHQAWLNSMCNMFGTCTERLVTKLDALADTGTVINMEENWNSCSLDIIGKAIFNYDFGSVDKLSPVVEAALGALREAEHRSTFYFPYWKIPGLGAEWPIPALVPRQRKFQQDMQLLNSVICRLLSPLSSHSLTRSLLVHSLACRPARVHHMSLNTQPSDYGAVGVWSRQRGLLAGSN